MSENEKAPKNELTEDQIDAIAKAGAESVPEGAPNMQKIKESVQVDPNAELEAKNVPVPAGSDGTDAIDIIAKEVENLPAADVSIFDADNPIAATEEAEKRALDKAKDELDLSDEEVLDLMDLMSNFQKDPKYPVYKNMPEPMKKVVRDIAFQNAIPANKLNEVAKMILTEMLADAGMEKVFVDFEKSIKEALNMPSVTDMYMDSIKDTMLVRIPETIEKIKDESPEKAEMLAKIRDSFIASYTFERAIKAFEESTRLRKAIRRYDIEFKHALDGLNFKNQNTKFRMNDAHEVPVVLKKVFDEIMYSTEPDDRTEDEFKDYEKAVLQLEPTDVDIKKFCILIAGSCDGLDGNDTISAAYMYYLLKNIIMLKLANNAKGEFAAELIINICKTIQFIRDKEAEFHAEHMDEPKRKEKRSKRRKH